MAAKIRWLAGSAFAGPPGPGWFKMLAPPRGDALNRTEWQGALRLARPMHPIDLLAWFRLGRPKAGTVTEHERLTYKFEQGIEIEARLEKVFGDPGVLRVADLGAGTGESQIACQILEIPWRRLVSIEAHVPYANKLRAKKAKAERHDVLAGRVGQIFEEYKQGELDVALLIDVIEHFDRRRALALLHRLESFFVRGAILFAPLGRVSQEPYDGNPLQRHRSSWSERDFARLGYSVEVYRGLHGQKTPPVDAAWAIKRWG